MKKMLDVKNEMLDKLRMEVAELSLVLNNDKYKSIRTIEVIILIYNCKILSYLIHNNREI